MQQPGSRSRVLLRLLPHHTELIRGPRLRVRVLDFGQIAALVELTDAVVGARRVAQNGPEPAFSSRGSFDIRALMSGRSRRR